MNMNNAANNSPLRTELAKAVADATAALAAFDSKPAAPTNAIEAAALGMSEYLYGGPEANHHGLIIQRSIMAGGVGHARTGGKIHRLHVSEVVGIVEGHTPPARSSGAHWLREQGRLDLLGGPRRVFFSAHASCNGNGQNVGWGAGKGVKLDAINCSRCKP